jgi:hypothetical protein
MRINNTQINQAIKTMKSRVEEAVIQRLQFIGEKFLSNARINADFIDRTGNLRSSIGYVIIKNGLQQSGSDWIMIRQGKEGIVAGKRIIDELSRKYPTGIILICVAGMEYAAAVESKGYDVITSSAFLAENDFKKMISGIKTKPTT